MNNLQLIKKIHKLLNFADREFFKQIKINKNISNQYKKIGNYYLIILKYLETNSHLPLELKFYKLASSFGLLKCEVNSFQLLPLDNTDIQKNETQLLSYTLRIQQFLKLTHQLEQQFNFGSHSNFYKEFSKFKKKIIEYAKNWEKYENDITAAYTYNYANILLKANPASFKKIAQAIIYFQQSSDCYMNNRRHKEKEQTQKKISEAEAVLAQLQLDQTTQLKVSIPVFLFSKIEEHPIPSVSIGNTMPCLTHSAKMKTVQPKQSSESIHIKLNLRRSPMKQKANNTFFQPKKVEKVVIQNFGFSYKYH
ncbi:MAG: hypothetical protein E6K54_02205 [Gammaproteobacteria bacterium]|nr:MAG: hypothetical protein E6K54_02205 [Gammaproteobacteria bacterium]